MSDRVTIDQDARYHYLVVGNGPDEGRVLAWSLTGCEEGPDCERPHVKLIEDPNG
jgi:hypothetical protein